MYILASRPRKLQYFLEFLPLVLMLYVLTLYLHLPRRPHLLGKGKEYSQSSVTPLRCIFCQELCPPRASFSSTPVAALPTSASVSTGTLATISYTYSPQLRQSNGSKREVHTMKPKVLKVLQQVQRMGSEPQKRAPSE